MLQHHSPSIHQVVQEDQQDQGNQEDRCLLHYHFDHEDLGDPLYLVNQFLHRDQEDL